MSARDCPAGMIAPTSGDAVINGMSIRDQMGRIRQSLGVCPQFDILWPNITVAEHLQLYAAIKGYRGGAETEQAVTAAARNVGALVLLPLRPAFDQHERAPAVLMSYCQPTPAATARPVRRR